MRNDPAGTLLVFLKFPEAGKVKTRLAAEIGAETAAGLYRDWIGRVLRAVQPVRPGLRVVGCFAGASQDRFVEWDESVDEWLPQAAGGLGERLTAAFDAGHARGGCVIAIGTDCPD